MRMRLLVLAAASGLLLAPLAGVDDFASSFVKNAFARGGGGGGGAGSGAGGAGAGAGAGSGGGSGGAGAGAGAAGGGGGGAAALGMNEAVREAFLRSPRAVHTAKPADREELRIVRGFRNAQGHRCRVVAQTVVIGGQHVRATGTLCQQSDGHWALARDGERAATGRRRSAVVAR